MNGFFGALLGALAIVLYYYTFDYCFAPNLLYDGYGTSFFALKCVFLAPQGIWLGWVTGYALSNLRFGNPKKAVFASFGGVLLFLIIPVWFVIVDPFHSYPDEPSERWSQLAYYFGAGLSWATFLIMWSVHVWVTSREA